MEVEEIKSEIINGLVSLVRTPYFNVMTMEYGYFMYDLCYWRFSDTNKVSEAVQEILKEQPVIGYEIQIPNVWFSFWPRGDIKITKK